MFTVSVYILPPGIWSMVTKQAQDPKDLKPPTKQIAAKNDTPGKENLGFGNVQRCYIFLC